MEMNTRLQVEHPVTEMITGLDLVEWQLRVAAGEQLPLTAGGTSTSKATPSRRASTPRTRAATSCPSTGRAAAPRVSRARAPKSRVDTGVEAGGEITPWYDPMIAKLVVHGRDRGEALARLRAALAEVEIAGVTTNVEFLRKVAASRAFSRGRARYRADRAQPRGIDFFQVTSPGPIPRTAAAFAELAHEETRARDAWPPPPATRIRPGTASTAGGSTPRRTTISSSSKAASSTPCACASAADAPGVSIAGREYHGKSTRTHAVRDGNDWHVLCDGSLPPAVAQAGARGRRPRRPPAH